MLVYSGRTVFASPAVFSGAFNGQVGNVVKGGLQNRVAGGFNAIFSAYPNGALDPSSFIMPRKAGSIASYTLARATITGSAVLIEAKLMVVSGTIEITVSNAQLDQIVPIAASDTISIVTNSAALAAAVNASATGTIVLSVDQANLGGVFEIDANGTIVVTESAVLSALAWIEAEAGGPTPLSPEGLAGAVWGSNAVDNNESGTMGELLNDAGAAGNPWAADLASNNTDGTFGGFVQKLLSVAKFLGLK